jgi:hypothetical protein
VAPRWDGRNRSPRIIYADPPAPDRCTAGHLQDPAPPVPAGDALGRVGDRHVGLRYTARGIRGAADRLRLDRVPG